MRINDKTFFVRTWTVSITMIVCAFFANAIRSDEPAQYLGPASCASATCHGGIPGRGPAWNSALRNWEANDLYHSGAGQVLMNEHSKRIVTALVRGSTRDDGATGEALHHIVLQERCSGCHAPSLAFAPPAPDHPLWLDGIRDGVSCEACHGPAAGWLTLHTLTEPDQKKLASSGKIATELWPDRTDNCLRCHVGSRTQDGTIRDMNHDMIAAGHPALRFDMSESQLRLPAHWDVAPPKRVRADSRFAAVEATYSVPIEHSLDFELATPGEHYHAQARALVAVTRLSLERIEASRAGQAPWPELAEYNCFACHQKIGYQTASASNAPQCLTWNAFYRQRAATDADLIPFGNGRAGLALDATAVKLTELLKAVESQHFAPLGIVEALRSAADLTLLQQAEADWQMAASWLRSNRLVLLNAGLQDDVAPMVVQNRLAAKNAAELAALLDEFEGILNRHSHSTSIPIGSTPEVPIGPETTDFDHLLRLGAAYRIRVAAILDSTNDSPKAGVNP